MTAVLPNERVADIQAIGLQRSLSLRLPSTATEQESLEGVLDQLAPIFESVPPMNGERAGALLVVSDNAGSATSVKFWSDALAVGIAVASPGAFPWCLANAPCATIARRFAIVGPNVTWLSAFAEPRVAFEPPSAWLADWLAPQDDGSRHAWLVSLHFGARDARARIWHVSSPPTGVAAADLGVRLRDIFAADWSTDLGI